MIDKELIRRANIVSSKWDGEKSIGCYLGNGRFGAIMSGLGLNLHPDLQREWHYFGPSHFTHINHWGRFPRMNGEHLSSSDFIVPFFKLYWSDIFNDIDEYYQCHDLYDGVLNTRFCQSTHTSVQVTNWFDSIQKDMAGVIINVDSSSDFSGKICLSAPSIPPDWAPGKDNRQSVEIERSNDEIQVVITCSDLTNNCSTKLYISTNMDTEISDAGLIFHVIPGKNTLLMSVNSAVSCSCPEDSLEHTKEWWHNTWGELSWIDYSNEHMNTILIRGLAYLLSSYDVECELIQPNCMGVGGFPFNFVPDLQYAAPALMMMGKLDIVKHWVEYFAKNIDDMRRYTNRLWPDAKGIFPPWELNYGPIDGYHYPMLPNINCYEAHNTGYLCRLATEAIEFSNDKNWAEKYAYPLIQGCAEFFRSACRKEADGYWHLQWYPCMGRDEAGGFNKDDYLCTLYAAKYSFQSAIKFNLDDGCDYKQILEDGLAFPTLLAESGILSTCRNGDNLGKQKHPIQLEGIACFPTEAEPLPEEISAYRMRHDITWGAKLPRFAGWTLAQFLVADSNMKSYQDWIYDWNLIRPSNNIDAEWKQFYESSSSFSAPFYLSTHGMVMQSLIRNCVNDYWNRLDIGTCLPKGAFVRFENIHTRLGVSVTGVIENSRFSGHITALCDCEIWVGKDMLTLKQGETRLLEMKIE